MATHLDPETCRDPARSFRDEWLETNEIGGYASGTVAGCRTRKYHGLLVASLASPPGRFLLLAGYEDSLLSGKTETPLACHRYPGVLHPGGYRFLTSFSLDLCPAFTFQNGPCRVTRQILMPHGENTVLVRYSLEQPDTPVTLRLKPLLAFRDHHWLKQEDTAIRTAVDRHGNGFDISPYDGMPTLHIRTSIPSVFHDQPDWYRNFEYEREAERGYDYRESLFCPGFLEVALRQGQDVVVAASAAPVPTTLEEAWNKEITRRRRISLSLPEPGAGTPPESAALLPGLIRAGRQFVIRTPTGRPAIVAGYPWFDDWGRDTLISLPGLTFCSGDPETGIAILQSVGNAERDGLIPNFFAADPAHHAYNAVDASLWYFRSVQHMLQSTGDFETIRSRFWPVMQRILAHFMQGTRNRIFMNENGLLHAGSHDTQLTWMDAKSHGRPVTPRHGYAVEINALWYNALCFSASLGDRFQDPLPWPTDLPDRCRAAFLRLFWLEDSASLADSFADGQLDGSTRPNQILAVSLPFTPLSPAQQAGVVEKVRRELLTPYGLRTLAPSDPAYRGRYEGNQDERDAAYHQGTVWPWLLGHYAEALLRVAPDRKAAASDLLATIRPLLDYVVRDGGLGQVPEIFDGDPPHRPNGCFAQAWSVAELIRMIRMFAL